MALFFLQCEKLLYLTATWRGKEVHYQVSHCNMAFIRTQGHFFFVSNGDASNGKTVDFILVGVYSEVKLCLFVAQGVGRSWGSERAEHSQPPCPPYQHFMKYLDCSIFEGKGCAGCRLCEFVMVEGSPPEIFEGKDGLCVSQLIFVREIEKWREGEEEKERLFSIGIWILGHTGPGVSQSGRSEGGGWAGGPRRAD